VPSNSACTRQAAGRWTHRYRLRRSLGTLACGLLLALAGCASAPPTALTAAQREKLGSIQAQTDSKAPAPELDVFATGRPLGAIKGAALGAGLGLGLTAVAWGTSDHAVIGSGGRNLAVGAIATVVFFVGGAIEGAFAVVPTQTAEAVERGLLSDAGRMSMTGELDAALRRRLSLQAPGAGADSLLEVTLQRLGARCEPQTGTLTLFTHCEEPYQWIVGIEARARVVRSADRLVLYEGRFEHASAPYAMAASPDASGANFTPAIEEALDGLAVDIAAWLH
jgi:hypothetical protein